MFSLYALKPGFQNLLRPTVRALAAQGITPNQVTVFTGAASVLLGAMLLLQQPSAAWRWLLLPIFLPVRMALNAIDGMLAREHHMTTRSGAVLNEALDLASDIALTLPFLTVPGTEITAVVAATVTAVGAEAAGLACGKTRRYDGPFGKSDRAAVLGVAGAWLGLGWPVAVWAARGIPWVWTGLCVLTAWNRLRIRHSGRPECP